jgi:hypothetical protein
MFSLISTFSSVLLAFIAGLTLGILIMGNDETIENELL